MNSQATNILLSDVIEQPADQPDVSTDKESRGERTNVLQRLEDLNFPLEELERLGVAHELVLLDFWGWCRWRQI